MRANLRRLRAWLLARKGFNLVILTMSITVLNIMVAITLPLVSHQIQRDQEAELIFRGLQYAEAIRVFQQRQGRLPVRMQELMEVEPRSIRQLWKNPMNEDGTWALILQAQGGRPAPRPRGDAPRPAPDGGQPPNPPPGTRPPEPDRPDGGDGDGGQPPGSRPPGAGNVTGANIPSAFGNNAQGSGSLPVPTFTPGQEPSDITGGSGAQVTVAPTQGVHDLDGRSTTITFFGDNETSAWRFTPELLQPQQGGMPGVAGAGSNNGRPAFPPNAGVLGKPFPPGITPPSIGGVGRLNNGLEKPTQREPGGRSR